MYWFTILVLSAAEVHDKETRSPWFPIFAILLLRWQKSKLKPRHQEQWICFGKSRCAAGRPQRGREGKQGETRRTRGCLNNFSILQFTFRFKFNDFFTRCLSMQHMSVSCSFKFRAQTARAFHDLLWGKKHRKRSDCLWKVDANCADRGGLDFKDTKGAFGKR